MRRGFWWHGGHAFRRGLATNLNRLGVRDKTIQAILRHTQTSANDEHLGQVSGCRFHGRHEAAGRLMVHRVGTNSAAA